MSYSTKGIVSFEYPLYYATDEEMDYFLGKLVKGISRAASGVAKAAGSIAKGVGQGVKAVTKFVPLSTLTSTLANTPMGFAVRAGLGAVSAAASGRNVFQGALRSMAASPMMRFAVDTGAGIAHGENILKAAQRAGQAGIGDVRESLRFAAMVAPFVPGIGTGAAAALAAANALASGERISDALIAAARNAVPGGALAQTAFDMAANLAKGKKLSEAALDAARSRLPGGLAAQAAFDSGLALAQGKSLQDSLIAGGGRLLPKSPYAANVLSFVKKAAAGENLGKAALSSAGNLVMKRIEQQAGPIISKAVGRLPIPRQQVHRRLGGIPSFGREVSELAPVVSPNSTGVWTWRGSNVSGSAAGYAPQMESFEYDFEAENSEATAARLTEQSFLKALIAGHQRDPNKLTDEVFYRRHPELRGKRIGTEQTALKKN